MDTNFPCKDCITLAICKRIFKENALVFDYRIAREALSHRCSIISLYVDPPFSKPSIVALREDALNVYMMKGKLVHEKYL